MDEIWDPAKTMICDDFSMTPPHIKYISITNTSKHLFHICYAYFKYGIYMRLLSKEVQKLRNLEWPLSKVIYWPIQWHSDTRMEHMMTSSNANIFRVTGHLCREFTGHWWIPRTKASDAELWCFLWSTPDKQLSKQSWGRWFETPSRSLWRHCNGCSVLWIV